jgi:hypothetical protein
MADVLSPTMTVRDFENGYWYLEQLKNFAERIGVPAAKKLRKDELEKAIVVFLRTGKAALPTKRSLRTTGAKDVERGLDLKLRIENYTSNRETKDFIVEQAHLMAPEVREKPGVWYRLNRWREEQITSGKAADVRRSGAAVHRSEQDTAIREGPSRSLHQLRRRVPRCEQGGDTCRGSRCVDRAQGPRRPQELRVLGQGASEAQRKEEPVTTVVHDLALWCTRQRTGTVSPSSRRPQASEHKH